MKAEGKGVEERWADGVQVERGSIATGVGQEILIVVIKDNVAPSSEVAAVALPAGMWWGQMTGDIETHRLTGGGGAGQKMEGCEHIGVGSEQGCKNHATAAHAVCAAGMDQAGGDVLVKIVEMVETLKMENLSLHGELVARRAAYARSLIDIIRQQSDRKRAVKEKEEAV